jgi:hypothetical protein
LSFRLRSANLTFQQLEMQRSAMPDSESEKPQTPAEEAGDRRAANIFLLVAGAILVAVGVWLADAMVDARKADECMSSGRRNCSPIDVPPR